MGGCRCYFRQCNVSNAKFPRMHFFRFPIKEAERYRKWRLYSKMEHMLQFTEVRRGNTSICARHFRTECFMNYKMDRLVPSAVPTIMRLSKDQALDFELNIETGVLVTLEEPKFKHLIPPVGFECPLFLANDTVLLEKLKELQSQQQCSKTNLKDVDYEDSRKPAQYEKLETGKAEKNLVNSIEILETIQVSAPKTKRFRELGGDEGPNSSSRISNKKCKILNPTNFAGDSDLKSGTSILLSSRSLQLDSYGISSDEADIIETDQIENAQELISNEEEYFLTADTFSKSGSVEADDIEIFEIHKSEDSLNYDLPSNDSVVTIVQLKTDKPAVASTSQQVLEVQNQFHEYKKKCEDLDILQLKFSVLEAENNELKKACKDAKHVNKKLLSLEIENSYIKETLKDYKALKAKLHKFMEENEKLKQETASIEALKSEVLSRTKETNELKTLLESLKKSQKDEKDLALKCEMNIENDLEMQVLKDNQPELNELKETLNVIKNENNRLKEHQIELEQSLNNIQNNFEIKQTDYSTLKSDYESLQQKHSTLKQKYWKLQALQNEEATVTTSLRKNASKANTASSTLIGNSFTKAQLFNGIKRYLSASMVSLLRMEMFGSSEREWKSDERQIAVDILHLGEMVYKYFCEEWRFRLPALRDVRVWLNQSQLVIDDEEDL